MEKEKLFFNLHLIIKDVGNSSNSLIHSDRNEWIKRLHSKIGELDDKTLCKVLDVYSRLKSYSTYNLSFIILHADLLEGIFYKDGEFIEEKLELLYEPYAKCMNSSHIITEFCFTNKITIEEIDRYLFINSDKETLETIIQEGEKINISFIVENLELFFNIHQHSPKLETFLNLGPLHKMQIMIYENTKPENANSDRKRYIQYLLGFKRRNEKNALNKVIDYIKSCEFVEYETVEIIGAMDIKCFDKLIKKYGKKVVFEEILLNPDLRKLSKYSPKLLMRLLNLYFNKDSNRKLIRTAKIFSNMPILQISSIEDLL